MDFPTGRLFFIVQLASVSLYLLWSPQFCSAQENGIRHRPVLTPAVQTIDTMAGRDFELTCRGVMPIDWELPHSSQRNDDKILIATVNLPDGVVKSILTVRRPTGLWDTGRYKCKYTTSPQEEATNDGSRYARSIYVFVNDPAHFFTNNDAMSDFNGLPDFVTVSEGKPSVIPCRPTYFDAKVELLGQNNQPISEDITYDPTIGFTVLYPNIFFSGDFTCRFKVKVGGIEKRSDKEMHLFYIESIDPPVPHIDKGSVRHVATGNDFSMVCEVHTRPEGLVALKWTLPSNSIKQRATTVDHVQQKVSPETGMRFKAIRKTLTVRGAKLADSGDYKCSSEVQWNTGKIASQIANVKIYPGILHDQLYGDLYD